MSVDRFTVAADHPSLVGHFPGHPIVPGVVLLDATLACLRAQGLSEGGNGDLTLQTAKFTRPVRPGDHVKVLGQRTGQAVKFTGWVDGCCVLRGSARIL